MRGRPVGLEVPDPMMFLRENAGARHQWHGIRKAIADENHCTGYE